MNDQSDLPQSLQHPHWGEVAYHWHHYGPPLRPSAAEVRVMEEMVRRWYAARRARPPKALLLGVTPEIAAMAWPDETELVAADRSEPMIQRVWPGDVGGRRKAVCADWFDLSSGSDTYDVVIGDGTFTILDYPGQYRALAATVRDVLASDGIFISRFFLRPAMSETAETVFDDLLANRIATFHGFKFRLAMALQESADSGVRMGDVYSAWRSAAIDLDSLMAMTGWPAGAIETIRLYEGKDSRLSFPSAAEMDAAMSEHFEKIDKHYLPMQMGERCPIVSYRRRK